MNKKNEFKYISYDYQIYNIINMTSGALTAFHFKPTDFSNGTLNDKYLLISAKSCPYAHRIEIVRNIKGLHNNINIVWCDPEFKFSGWSLDYNYNQTNPSKLFNSSKLMELYKLFEPSYSGRNTLPLLLNTSINKIINNESSEIIKIFNNDFDEITLNKVDLYPESQRQLIDDFCNEFNQKICTDTYKTGHAKSQTEYEQLFNSVFEYLDKFDNMLINDYIIGNNITLADIHAFPHLIRFDCIFYSLFSLNKKHLWEYKNINRYLKNLLSNSHFAETVDLNEMKKGAFGSENNYPENLGCRKIPIGNGGFEYYF